MFKWRDVFQIFYQFRVFLTLFLLSLVLTVFQNCGSPGANPDMRQDQLLPQSPFAGQRVRLLKPLDFNQSSEEEIKNFKPEKVVLLMRNRCVTDWCETAPDAADSLACEIIKDNPPQKELENSFQAYSWKIDPSTTDEALEDELRNNSVDNECIVGVAHDLVYKMDQAPVYTTNDPEVDHEYYHQVLNGPSAYEYFYKEQSSVTIGVIDTGAQSGTERHENLSSSVHNTLVTPDANDTEACRTICHWHGHFVANIIRGLRNNSRGGHGIHPNATIWMLQVGDSEGKISTTQLVNALQNAHYYGIEIVNMSLAGSGLRDFAVQDRMISLMNQGTLIVVSAGNDSRDISITPTYPASFNFDGQITVGAASPEAIINTSNNPPYSATMLNSPIRRDVYSNYSSSLVHISAPGTRIYSAMLNNTYGYRNGTSFSTPMVTAAAALLKGHLKFKGINASPLMLKSLLLEGTRSLDSLNEMREGQSQRPFQNNRFLDLERLAQVTRDFVNLSSQLPGRIELVSSGSYVNASTGLREVRVTVDVRDATSSMGYVLRAYTNSSFLEESDTGYTCNITSTRQVCEIIIPYNQIFADPHVYLRVVDAEGRLISDLTIPKTAINLGVKADAQLKGEIIAAFHYNSSFQIEGWACLEGFADPIQIEVHRERHPTLAPIILQTNRQARGNYFTECNAPEISFGFRYTIPSSRFYEPMIFKARHIETGKVIDLRILSHQPGYGDTSTAQAVSSIDVDDLLMSNTITFNITRYELRNWILHLEGSACKINNDRSPSFKIGIDFNTQDPFQFLRTVPSVRGSLPPEALMTSVSSIQEAVDIQSISRAYSIRNPTTRAVAEAGSLGCGGGFSDIHYVCVFNPNTAGIQSQEVLLTYTDSTAGPSGFLTVTPDQNRSDGCRHPSGFQVSFDIRNIFTSASGSSGLTYRADVYTEQQLLSIPGITNYLPFLKLSEDLNLTISDMVFDPRLFPLYLQPSFGEQRTYLSLSRRDFGQSLMNTVWPKVRNQTLATEDLIITQISNSNRRVIPKTIKVSAINIPINRTQTNLAVVYETPLIPVANTTQKVLPYLSYGNASLFGFINEDFRMQIFLQSTGLWYDINMSSLINSPQPLLDGETVSLSQGIIYGDAYLAQPSTGFKLRVLSNHKNKMNLTSIGYYFE